MLAAFDFDFDDFDDFESDDFDDFDFESDDFEESDDPDESDDFDESDDPDASDEPDESALLLAYPSLYQPPPLRWNAAADRSFSSFPPQVSHFFIGGSEKRWMCSSSAPHFVQRYA